MLSSEEKRARLQKALDQGGGTHTLQDVIDLVREGKAQFWENGDGSIITEVHTYPRRKDVHYWLASGDLRCCLELQSKIDPWAISRGCTMATITGRKGWLRAAAEAGWALSPNLYQMYKPLVED
jgi:hypothetical protein